MSKFSGTRKTTLDLCGPLERDDYMVQSTPDTSPPKWHLGHTTWFFETFILEKFSKGYRRFDNLFPFIFNSYYETVGKYVPKPSRSVNSRPSLEKVIQYRESVNREMEALLEDVNSPDHGEIMNRTLLGINHEQQHQELLLMDIKRNLFSSPYLPEYIHGTPPRHPGHSLEWMPFPESISETGFHRNGFFFDNEGPRHRELIPAFSMASRPVTNGEYIRFMEDGGYRKPELWLSAGWDTRMREGWEMPLYWSGGNGEYRHFTFYGMSDVDPDEPVMHVSYYEADAFARWSGAHLPTEFQWEHAATSAGEWKPSSCLENSGYAPSGAMNGGSGPGGMGNAWEWTSSAYLPYPGFRPLPGSLGEYNGKFMSGQMVLRGSSYATPRGHSRPTYRNFYHPGSRWQFSGLRLSKDDLNE